MADGGQHLASAGKRLHEGHHVLVQPQNIGVHLAAGQHQGIVVGGPDIGNNLIDIDFIAPIIIRAIPALYGAAFERDDVDFGALAFEVFLGFVEFRLLEAVGGNNGNFLALEFVAAEDTHSVWRK